MIITINPDYSGEITTKLDALDIYIQVRDFSPARPAPPAGSHDSPAWSDPGDDAEYDFSVFLVRVCANDEGIFNRSLDITDFLTEDHLDAIHQEIDVWAAGKASEAEDAWHDAREAEND